MPDDNDDGGWYEEDEGEGDPNGRDDDYDPNDPRNLEEEEEEEDDDDDDGGNAVMVNIRPSKRTGLVQQLRAFKEKHDLIVASATPDGHCGFMSVALQPAKPPRSNPPMSSQTKTLRVAVANIIEKKEHRPRLAMLLTGWSDGDGDAERALVQRAKEHRKVNTSVTLSHSTGMWFNHVDAQAIATFQQRTLFIVDSKTATANKIPPLPDRVEPNIELSNVELPEDPSDRIVLLFANSHYDALLAAKKRD